MTQENEVGVAMIYVNSPSLYDVRNKMQISHTVCLLLSRLVQVATKNGN